MAPAGARRTQRGSEHVVSLSELSAAERRVVLALLEAARAAADPDRGEATRPRVTEPRGVE
jgi:hypothetical protein